MMTRSASPSNAMPTWAFCRFISAHICSGWTEPHPRLMLVPSGLQLIENTCAPSSDSTLGATLYVAPLAQSTTIFMPSNIIPLGIEVLTNSMYRPTASSIRNALPTLCAVGLMSSISPDAMRFSIRSSISSGSLNPVLEKNLMPLSSYGLWDAEMTTPASALRLRVMSATAGVGIGPTSRTSTPIEQIPATSADSIM